MSAFKPMPLLGALLLAACGQQDAGGGDAAATNAQLASLPPPYNSADLANGKAKFAQCRACHTVVKDGANMTGPNLYGVFGRTIATKPGFQYSDAAKAAGFVWDAEHLDAWIANPRTYLPGTKMTFVGFADAKDRIDLIAYLKTETGYGQ